MSSTGHPARARLAEVLVNRADGFARRGTGYLVAPGLVLTAAHVVAGARTVAVWLGSPRELETADGIGVDLAATLLDPEADLALLPLSRSPAGVEPVLLGRLDRELPEPVPAVFAGFPRFKVRPAPGRPGVLLRELRLATGWINPGSDAKTGTLELAVREPPAEDPQPREHSPWEGMSGAAVWVSGRLIGVVGQHHPGEGLAVLTVRPLTALFDGPDPDRWRAALPQLGPSAAELFPATPPAARHLKLRGASDLIAEFMPPVLIGRQAELDELAGFATSGRWRWVRGEAFTGKSALLSWFALHPPEGVDVAAFALRSTTAQADAATVLSLLNPQLAALAMRPDPKESGVVWERTREFLTLLAEAGEAGRQRGRRLLVLIDGLDEDLTRESGLAVAAWLPDERTLPAGACLLVSSRSGVAVPVPAGHPLWNAVTVLEPSEVAADIEQIAAREIRQVRQGRDETTALLGFLTVAYGGLSPAELALLVRRRGGGPLDAVAVSDRLEGLLGRTVSRTQDPDGLAADLRVFSHAALRGGSARQLAGVLDDYRHTIDELAAEYRERGWPGDTPRYLLRAYPRQLVVEADGLPPGDQRRASIVAILTALVDSPARGARLLERIGHPAAHNDEITAVQELLLRSAEPGEALLRRLLALSLARHPIAGGMAKVAREIAPIWVRTGRARPAHAFARAVQDRVERDFALRAVGVAAAGQPGELALALEVADELRGRDEALQVLAAAVAAEARRDVGAAVLLAQSAGSPVACVDVLTRAAGENDKTDTASRTALCTAARGHAEAIRSTADRARALALVARTDRAAAREIAARALVLAPAVPDPHERRGLVARLISAVFPGPGHPDPPEVIGWVTEPGGDPAGTATSLGLVLNAWAETGLVGPGEAAVRQLLVLALQWAGTQEDHHTAAVRLLEATGDDIDPAVMAHTLTLVERDRALQEAVTAVLAEPSGPAVAELRDRVAAVTAHAMAHPDPASGQGSVVGMVLSLHLRGLTAEAERSLAALPPDLRAVCAHYLAVRLAEDGDFARATAVAGLGDDRPTRAATLAEIAVRVARTGAAEAAVELLAQVPEHRAAALLALVPELPDGCPAPLLVRCAGEAAAVLGEIADAEAAAEQLARLAARLARAGQAGAAIDLVAAAAPEEYDTWTLVLAGMLLCRDGHRDDITPFAEAVPVPARPRVLGGVAAQFHKDYAQDEARAYAAAAARAALALGDPERVQQSLAEVAGQWSEVILGDDLRIAAADVLIDEPEELFWAFLGGIAEPEPCEPVLNHLMGVELRRDQHEDALATAQALIEVAAAGDRAASRWHQLSNLGVLARDGWLTPILAMIAELPDPAVRVTIYARLAGSAPLAGDRDALRAIAAAYRAAPPTVETDEFYGSRSLVHTLATHGATEDALAVARVSDRPGELLALVARTLLDQDRPDESAAAVAEAVHTTGRSRKPQREADLVLAVTDTLVAAGFTDRAGTVLERLLTDRPDWFEAHDRVRLLARAAALLAGRDRAEAARSYATEAVTAARDAADTSGFLRMLGCTAGAVALSSAGLDGAEDLAAIAAEAAADAGDLLLFQQHVAGCVAELAGAGLLGAAAAMARSIPDLDLRCDAFAEVGTGLAGRGDATALGSLIAEVAALGDTAAVTLTVAWLTGESGAAEEAIAVLRSCPAPADRARGLAGLLHTAAFAGSPPERAELITAEADRLPGQSAAVLFGLARQLVRSGISATATVDRAVELAGADAAERLIEYADGLGADGRRAAAADAARRAVALSPADRPEVRVRAQLCRAIWRSAGGADTAALVPEVHRLAVGTLLDIAARLRKLGRVEASAPFVGAALADSLVTPERLCAHDLPDLALDQLLARSGAGPSADELTVVVRTAREIGDTGTAGRAIARLVVSPEFREHLHLLPGEILATAIDDGQLTFGPAGA
ncbi:trypsin-like peptidase domain-containing protein [Actinoplanes oblitus]|uniref:Trypsin-like peptidase domain-containing protein n=1 Tax=Actinoplanes oblitus TaxID=3040509 RepID=A0ABY8W623_9ACTN|nr:trypsin-like peptidase domain-containing protein [Actinoplanes oblitus]WIM93250.1 trypsin-like peptidase domain-containing protein [Actinoplanes oblitus]